jgi:hypothetical protein
MSGRTALLRGSDADDPMVECGMVDLAQRQPIRNHRLTAISVGHDVRGIEQSTLASVGVENDLAKPTLVESLLDQPRGVGAPGRFAGESRALERSRNGGASNLQHARLRLHPEPQLLGFIANHEHGPYSQVAAFDNGVEVDERQPLMHGRAQTNVLAVPGVITAIAVRQGVVDELIVVGRTGAGPDAQRQRTHRRSKKIPCWLTSGTRRPA